MEPGLSCNVFAWIRGNPQPLGAACQFAEVGELRQPAEDEQLELVVGFGQGRLDHPVQRARIACPDHV